MFFCYIDECGDSGQIDAPTSPIMPAFCFLGLFVPHVDLKKLTIDFLDIKRKFYPSISVSHFLDIINFEIKGADLRGGFKKRKERQIKQAVGLLDATFNLIKSCNCKIVSYNYIKKIGAPYTDRIMYTIAVQDIAKSFQNYLLSNGQQRRGIIIADSRRKAQNVNVAHSIFTQIYSTRGSSYPNILEMPTYGHAGNHAGLQIADILVSAIIFPIILITYCPAITNCHTSPEFASIKGRYAAIIKDSAFRYVNETGYWQGGIQVNDYQNRKSGADFFKIP